LNYGNLGKRLVWRADDGVASPIEFGILVKLVRR